MYVMMAGDQVEVPVLFPEKFDGNQNLTTG